MTATNGPESALPRLEQIRTISVDPDGFSINLCTCPDGAYLGARKAGTPCCCERCGFMTREQWDALAAFVWKKTRDAVRVSVAEELRETANRLARRGGAL